MWCPAPSGILWILSNHICCILHPPTAFCTSAKSLLLAIFPIIGNWSHPFSFWLFARESWGFRWFDQHHIFLVLLPWVLSALSLVHLLASSTRRFFLALLDDFGFKSLIFYPWLHTKSITFLYSAKVWGKELFVLLACNGESLILIWILILEWDLSHSHNEWCRW